MLVSFLLLLLPMMHFPSFTLAAPLQPLNLTAPPLHLLNTTVDCVAIPNVGVVPTDCAILLDNLDDVAFWADEYITFGIHEPGGRETPIFAHWGFCQIGVIGIFPEERSIERFRLKDYLHDLRQINSRCLLPPRSRFNAGLVPVGVENKFYGYLGGLLHEKARHGVAQA